MAPRKSILLRLRPEMYEALQRWAQDEFRSFNGQLEYLLDQSLRQAGRRPRVPRPGPGGEPREENDPGTPGASAPPES